MSDLSDFIKWQNFWKIEADSWSDENPERRGRVDGLQGICSENFIEGEFES